MIKTSSRVAQEWAEKAWKDLPDGLRFELGDALVLGTFTWWDWFDALPPPGGLDELDRLRILWEESCPT